jgi:hypothetical protein
MKFAWSKILFLHQRYTIFSWKGQHYISSLVAWHSKFTTCLYYYDMSVKMRTTCTWTERPYEALLFPGIGFGLFLRSLGGRRRRPPSGGARAMLEKWVMKHNSPIYEWPFSMNSLSPMQNLLKQAQTRTKQKISLGIMQFHECWYSFKNANITQNGL